MNRDVDASYAYCRQMARRAHSSFYLSFFLLPRVKRRSMCALYAFLRHTDDLADSDQPIEQRQQALAAWREALHDAMQGRFDSPLLPALADTVRRYGIPGQYLSDVIDGVEMDLQIRRYETFHELQRYCYRVASAVGLACIHIWGFTDRAAFQPAERCGLAFQLTNILRDLKEDAARDRVYLPLEDLRRFDYGPEDLLSGVCDERFLELMRYEIERAERLYGEAEPLKDHLQSDGHRIFSAMVGTYRGMLDQIRRRPAEVLRRRVSLRRPTRLWIAARSLFLRRPADVGDPP